MYLRWNDYSKYCWKQKRKTNNDPNIKNAAYIKILDKQVRLFSAVRLASIIQSPCKQTFLGHNNTYVTGSLRLSSSIFYISMIRHEFLIRQSLFESFLQEFRGSFRECHQVSFVFMAIRIQNGQLMLKL